MPRNSPFHAGYCGVHLRIIGDPRSEPIHHAAAPLRRKGRAVLVHCPPHGGHRLRVVLEKGQILRILQELDHAFGGFGQCPAHVGRPKGIFSRLHNVLIPQEVRIKPGLLRHVPHAGELFRIVHLCIEAPALHDLTNQLTAPDLRLFRLPVQEGVPLVRRCDARVVGNVRCVDAAPGNKEAARPLFLFLRLFHKRGRLSNGGSRRGGR